jgi:protease I
MKQSPIEGLRVAILATDGVEQSELTDPRKALDDAGATTKLIAPKAGRIQAMNHDERADRFRVDATLDRVNADEFDAVLLPGGALNADALRAEPAAQEFVRQIDAAQKPVAAICHAPWLLISAGIVEGRRLTGYHTIQDDVENAGGCWRDQPVVRDRNWVTSRQPSDLPAFDREMIALFSANRRGSTKGGTAAAVAPPVGR